MGSHDGAELCKLVGLYLLHQMRWKFSLVDFGLYRDDGLGCYKKAPGPVMERNHTTVQSKQLINHNLRKHAPSQHPRHNPEPRKQKVQTINKAKLQTSLHKKRNQTIQLQSRSKCHL